MISSYPRPQFGDFVGPWRKAFAWLPTKTYDGSLIWLRGYRRRRVQLHDYLPGPTTQWWWNDTVEWRDYTQEARRVWQEVARLQKERSE